MGFKQDEMLRLRDEIETLIRECDRLAADNRILYRRCDNLQAENKELKRVLEEVLPVKL